jgi:membrane associated rhomboid family serine protease
MLDDRSYMQEPQYQPKNQSAVVLIIMINVVVFLVGVFTASQAHIWQDYFYLSKEGVAKGFLWQLITFQFFHINFLHILFNCWALYVFGRHVEESQGKARFFRLYFISGVAGGLLFVAIAWAVSGQMISPRLLGASAGVYGLIAVFARLMPDAPLMIFPFPVSIKAKYLFFILIGIAGLGVIFSQSAGGVSHAAHLGGGIAGLLYAYYAIEGNRLPINLPSTPAPAKKARQPQTVSKVTGAFKRATKSGKEPAELTQEEFISREVDPILEKISAHGIHSLTDKERKVLESARSRLSHRLRKR